MTIKKLETKQRTIELIKTDKGYTVKDTKDNPTYSFKLEHALEVFNNKMEVMR